MTTMLCPECTQPMRDSMERCPHCFRPCLYPNVNAARRTDEVQALDSRYQKACEEAIAKKCEPNLRAYESAVSSSQAVINRSFSELQRLSYSEDEVYATFYQRIDSGLRLAGGDKWDRLRSIADTILFGEQNKRHVRFASLTVNDVGLPHYGECSLLLREEMISHRATVFEENSVMFLHRHTVHAGDDYKIPLGYRALWAERSRIAVAKIANPENLRLSSFEHQLLHPGPDERKDVFIEVHIWGSLTIRSIRKAKIPCWKKIAPSDSELQAVREKLTFYGVEFEYPKTP